MQQGWSRLALLASTLYIQDWSRACVPRCPKSSVAEIVEEKEREERRAGKEDAHRSPQHFAPRPSLQWMDRNSTTPLSTVATPSRCPLVPLPSASCRLELSSRSTPRRCLLSPS